MTGFEEKLKLAGLKSCLKRLIITYRRDFNRLAGSALNINEIIKEILKIEEGKNNEQNDK